jgi:hypothetical protein
MQSLGIVKPTNKLITDKNHGNCSPTTVGLRQFYPFLVASLKAHFFVSDPERFK